MKPIQDQCPIHVKPQCDCEMCSRQEVCDDLSIGEAAVLLVIVLGGLVVAGILVNRVIDFLFT